MAQGGFLSFQTFISSSLIKTIYVLGVIGITTAGAALALTALIGVEPPASDALYIPKVSALRVFAGLLIIAVGNLIWRVICESWILFFSMQDTLAAIKRCLDSDNGIAVKSHLTSEYLRAAENNSEQRHQELLQALSRLQPRTFSQVTSPDETTRVSTPTHTQRHK